MAGAKIIVIYPRPKDIEEFDKRYLNEHVPMAANLPGKNKIVATKFLGAPDGPAPFHVMAEVHFPTMEALLACASSETGKKTLAHGASISTGGPPIILIAEEQVFNFD